MYIITNLPLGPLKQAMNVYTFDSAFYYPGVLNLRRPIEDSFLCTRKKVIKIYLINLATSFYKQKQHCLQQ